MDTAPSAWPPPTHTHTPPPQHHYHHHFLIVSIIVTACLHQSKQSEDRARIVLKYQPAHLWQISLLAVSKAGSLQSCLCATTSLTLNPHTPAHPPPPPRFLWCLQLVALIWANIAKLRQESYSITNLYTTDKPRPHTSDKPRPHTSDKPRPYTSDKLWSHQQLPEPVTHQAVSLPQARWAQSRAESWQPPSPSPPAWVVGRKTWSLSCPSCSEIPEPVWGQGAGL